MTAGYRSRYQTYRVHWSSLALSNGPPLNIRSLDFFPEYPFSVYKHLFTNNFVCLVLLLKRSEPNQRLSNEARVKTVLETQAKSFVTLRTFPGRTPLYQD